MSKRSLGVVASLVALSSSACLERRLESVAPCTRSSVTQDVRLQYVDTVDLLFVIDDSGSMEEEQRSLEREIPRLVQVLASGDRDDDGVEDFRPVRSLQVGVVSTDLGAGVPSPRTLGACVHGVGEGGVLRRTAAGCSDDDDGVFSFLRGEDPTQFVSDVSCVTTLGTTGCGLEQPLEAALRAITPAEATTWTAPGYTPPRFLDPDTGAYSMPGNALGANAGFVREESVLAVVLVTDEEDCSAADTSIFADDATAAARFGGGDLQLRCTRFADRSANVLHAVERYVDGLVGLRREPGLVVFSAIAGIPSDLLEGASSARGLDYGAILADPRMQYAETGERENFLRDACTTSSGSADPARRVVATAAGLAERGVAVSLASICESDFGPAIDGVVARIADALNGACLPRDLNPDADGRVDCEVYEVLPGAGTTSSVTECARLGGRTLSSVVEIEGVPRERCLVTQLDRASGLAGTSPGWFYDDASAERAASCGEDGQRIAFTEIARPALGSLVQLECLQTIGRAQENADSACDESIATCELGMFCEPGAADRCGTGSTSRDGAPIPFVCDEVERLCAAPCTSDADCRSAGLSGHVCDQRTNGEAAGGALEIDPTIAGSIRGTCVNPTCN